jgi:hypothetical protein
MEHAQLLQHLDQLSVGGFDTWDFDRERQRYKTKVDGYTITVDPNGTDGYLWMLEHERYGVIMRWAHAATRAIAREEALAYTRAHLNAHFQHAHAE